MTTEQNGPQGWPADDPYPPGGTSGVSEQPTSGIPGVPGQPGAYPYHGPGQPYPYPYPVVPAQPGAYPYPGPPQPGMPGQPPGGHPIQPGYPGPAGYPVQPGQSPAGYPGQPVGYPGWRPVPGAIPPAPAAPGRRGRTIALVAGALVVLLLVGTGVAFAVARFVRSRDDNNDAAGMRIAWTVDYATSSDATNSDAGDMFAAWLTDQAVVRVQPDGVLAYQLTDGAEAWGVPAPDGTTICAATRVLADGFGAVAYGTDTRCDTVSGVDARSGKLTWTFKVVMPARSARGPLLAPRLRIAGPTLLVQAGNRLTGLGMTNGVKHWSLISSPGCTLADVTAGAELMFTAESCSDGALLSSMDPLTGRERWHRTDRTGPGDSGLRQFLTAEPLVVNGVADEPYRVLGERGEQLSVLDPAKIGVRLNQLPLNRSTAVEGVQMYPYLAEPGVLYFETFPENVSGKMRQQNQIVAVDPATGSKKWISTGHHDCAVRLIRVDEAGVLAWEVGDRRDQAPRLVRIARDSGRVTVVGVAPKSAGTVGDGAEILEQNGTVVIVPWDQTSVGKAITVLR